MADYYSILKKTISGLGKNTPEIRDAVYGKARSAIERQLRGITPQPSEAAIASQLALLEQAISSIATEYAELPPMPEPVAAPIAPAPQPAPQPTPAPEMPVPVTANLQQPAPTPPAEPSVATAPIAPARQPDPVVSEPTISSESSPTQSSVESVKTTAGALDAMSSAVQMDAQVGSGAPETATLEHVHDGAAFDQPKQKRSIGKIIMPLAILVLLGGAGYAAWLNKDALIGASENLVAEVTKPVEETSLGTENAGEVKVEKEPVRIGVNGEDTNAGPVDEQATANEETEVPVIVDPIVEPRVIVPQEPVQPEPEVAQTPDLELPEVVEPKPIEPVVEPVEEQVLPENAGTEKPAIIPIGEVAYLYEEGSAGAGATRTNAGVTWAIERQQIEQGSTREPVIIGKMEIPEKDMSLTISIKRNVDDALSASHLIEMRFDVPDGFPGQGIQEIARFVMKSTEEARGEALVAVPVKVSEGFFLVALDNLPQAVEVNTQLMASAAWIDIPVSYVTGKRALLTLEKGGSGEQAFKEAFADWKNRQ